LFNFGVHGFWEQETPSLVEGVNASRNIVNKYLDATGYPNTANVNLPNGNLIVANAPNFGS